MFSKLKYLNLLFFIIPFAINLVFADVLPIHLRAPQISADILFNELLTLDTDRETYQGWIPLVGGIYPISQKSKLNGPLSVYFKRNVWIPIPHLNSTPVQFNTEDTSEFFADLPTKHFLDSSYIVYKYYFFPQVAMSTEALSHLDLPTKTEPIPFYLVRKIDSNTDSESYELLIKNEFKNIPNSESFEKLKSKHLDMYRYFERASKHLRSDKSKSRSKARKYLKKSADIGYSNAAHALALMYLQGDGGPKNEELAQEYFNQAMQAGDPIAQVKLAELLFEHSEKSAILRGKAYQLVTDALSRESKGRAEFALANFYYTEKDFSKAFEHFTKSAELGFAQSYYNLGVMYLHGEGVPADRAEARKNVLKARELGFSPK